MKVVMKKVISHEAENLFARWAVHLLKKSVSETADRLGKEEGKSNDSKQIIRVDGRTSHQDFKAGRNHGIIPCHHHTDLLQKNESNRLSDTG